MSRPCPRCGAAGPGWKVVIVGGDMFVADPAGAQTTGRFLPAGILSCRFCDFTVSGYLVGLTLGEDGQLLRAGTFHAVPEPPASPYGGSNEPGA